MVKPSFFVYNISMEKYLVEGNISVKAALMAKRREVYEIYVDEKKKDKDTHFILMQANKNDVTVHKVTREKIEELAQGKTHGGMIGFVGEREYQKIEEIKDPFYAIAEGIEDPFNFGYICRSLYAAGCNGLIVPQRNYSTAVTTVTKSSAGASEYISLIVSDDIPALVTDLKKKGLPLYCAMRKDAIPYTHANYHQGFILAFGGEKRGLSKQLLALSDQNIYIPYANDFKNALNGASAASILAFEAFRQRDDQKTR